MTSRPTRPTTEPAPDQRSSAGLRLRIWIGCLGGALVAGGGMWWVIGTRALPGPELDMPALVSWLAAVAGLGVVVGAAFAVWLDRGIVSHLRGMTTSVATGQVARLRGLPAAAGWGELSELTQQLQLLITHHRQASRAAEELGLTRHQLSLMRESLEHWAETERWIEVRADAGPLAPVAEALNRGFRRLQEVGEQNQEAARQVGEQLGHALEDARESAEQAERGFVEATSLLTTVRELERLAGELSQVVPMLDDGRSSQAFAEAHAASRDAARSAIEELISSSTRSVEHLGRGFLKVHEIAEQVQRVANRATVIALDAALTSASAETPNPEVLDELRRLAADVRQATDRTEQLAADIERELQAASAEMHGVRDRVAQRLDQIPMPAPLETGRASESAARLLERVREMIQDATRKSERLSAAGERSSRAAERLLRGLEEEVGELEGLTARIAPPEATAAEPAPPAPEAAADRLAPESARPPGLKLLSEEHLLPGDDARALWPEPGASEERR